MHEDSNVSLPLVNVDTQFPTQSRLGHPNLVRPPGGPRTVLLRWVHLPFESHWGRSTTRVVHSENELKILTRIFFGDPGGERLDDESPVPTSHVKKVNRNTDTVTTVTTKVFQSNIQILSPVEGTTYFEGVPSSFLSILHTTTIRQVSISRLRFQYKNLCPTHPSLRWRRKPVISV